MAGMGKFSSLYQSVSFPASFHPCAGQEPLLRQPPPRPQLILMCVKPVIQALSVRREVVKGAKQNQDGQNGATSSVPDLDGALPSD